MKNPEKIKIEIEQIDTGERDVKTVELVKMLYSAWLMDKSDGIFSITALAVCYSLLTKEEMEEIERNVLGATLEIKANEISKELRRK